MDPMGRKRIFHPPPICSGAPAVSFRGFGMPSLQKTSQICSSNGYDAQKHTCAGVNFSGKCQKSQKVRTHLKVKALLSG